MEGGLGVSALVGQTLNTLVAARERSGGHSRSRPLKQPRLCFAAPCSASALRCRSGEQATEASSRRCCPSINQAPRRPWPGWRCPPDRARWLRGNGAHVSVACLEWCSRTMISRSSQKRAASGASFSPYVGPLIQRDDVPNVGVEDVRKRVCCWLHELLECAITAAVTDTHRESSAPRKLVHCATPRRGRVLRIGHTWRTGFEPSPSSPLLSAAAGQAHPGVARGISRTLRTRAETPPHAPAMPTPAPRRSPPLH